MMAFSWPGSKFIVIGSAVLVVGALAVFGYKAIQNSGRTAEQIQTLEENNEAGEAADEADLGRIDCQLRYGLRWNFAAQKCERS